MDSSPLSGSRLDLVSPDAYGSAFADVYDSWYEHVSDAEATAGFVAERCPSGTVLELGVGSGRLAIPLLAKGLTVIGVDASMAMLTKCPNGVQRVAADMCRLPFTELAAAGLVDNVTALCGFNTLFNLGSESQQQQFWSTLGRLRAVVIVETTNVELASGFSMGTARQTDGGLVVTSTSSDDAQQMVAGRHLEIDDEAVISRPWMLRWTGLEEMDGMAATAGLHLDQRFSSWEQTPYDTAAEVAISVFTPDEGPRPIR